MDIVIKIPEEIMDYIKNNGCLSVFYIDELAKAIKNGTPLPKGHVRKDVNMTIEKAIEILKSLWCYKDTKYSDTDIRKALDIAINSLEKFNDNANEQTR